MVLKDIKTDAAEVIIKKKVAHPFISTFGLYYYPNTHSRQMQPGSQVSLFTQFPDKGCDVS